MIYDLRFVMAGALVALSPQLFALDAGSNPQSEIMNLKYEESAATSVLQVHLPREVTVQSNLLTLGQISVLRGDPALAAAVGRIGLGQLSAPGQKAILDRATILSRLASQGITSQQVRLTGAEAVAVRRQQKLISSEEFIDAGKTFLRQRPPGPSICEMIPTVKPKDLVLPEQAADLQVTPRFIRTAARGFVTIQIGVMVDGKECGVREIPFRLKYQCRRVVTLKVYAERKPQPQPCNVHRERVEVNAVEIGLDNVQLALVQGDRVQPARHEQRRAQVEQFVEQAHQVRAAAASRVARSDGAQGRQHALRVL